MKLKKYRLILILVALMMGMSITGWSISTHYDPSVTSNEIQTELKNKNQTSNTVSGKFSKNSPILFLISTGLVGLVGVRRQRNRIEAFQSKRKVDKRNFSIN